LNFPNGSEDRVCYIIASFGVDIKRVGSCVDVIRGLSEQGDLSIPVDLAATQKEYLVARERVQCYIAGIILDTV